MTVRIALRPSRRLVGILLCAHLAAAALLIPLHVPPWNLSIIGALIALSLVLSVHRHALLRARASIVGVELRAGGDAAVQTRNGDWHPVRILGSSCITPVLTVLNLRERGRLLARHVVLLPDSAHAEDLRALRVRLRWGRYRER